MTFALRSATLLALSLSCVLAGGCATRLTGTRYYDTGLGYGGAEFDFGASLQLRVLADQGVSSFGLTERDGSYRLDWIGAPWSGTVPSKTLVFLGENVFEAGPGGQAIGGGGVLLIQGNGESRWTTAELAADAIGANARAYLGVSMSNDTVVLPQPNSPAVAAGVLARDRIVAAEIHGVRVVLANRLKVGAALLKLHPGERIVLIVEREGKEISLPLTLEERPRESWNQTDA